MVANVFRRNLDKNRSSGKQNLKIAAIDSRLGSEKVASTAGARLAYKSGPTISVVIPAMNEAKNLPHVLPLIPEWVHEVLLVDGRSIDNTVEVARRYCPNIRIVEQDGRGKGNALRAGFQAATGDIIVMIDADGSTRPEEISDFVGALLSGADFAKGSRFLSGGGTADMEWYRRIGNWGFVTLVRLGFGCKYSDLCYGYNAFWRSTLPQLSLDADGFEIETEMNIRAYTSGLNIVEVPSFEDDRIHGTSNLSTVKDGWRVLKTILREWSRNTFERSAPKASGVNGDNSSEIVAPLWLELDPDISFMGLTGEVPQILHSALQSVDATTGSLILIDEQGQVNNASLLNDGQIQPLLTSDVMDTVREGLAGWVVRNQQAALVENTCDDPRWLKRSWDVSECSSRSAISLPLLSNQRIAGVLTLVNNSAENKYTSQDLVALTGLTI